LEDKRWLRSEAARTRLQGLDNVESGEREPVDITPELPPSWHRSTHLRFDPALFSAGQCQHWGQATAGSLNLRYSARALHQSLYMAAKWCIAKFAELSGAFSRNSRTCLLPCHWRRHGWCLQRLCICWGLQV
jgi:hypothetical protein